MSRKQPQPQPPAAEPGITETPIKLRDRIKELRRVPASELVRNEKNWRRHPEGQRSALRHMLADVGFAGACLTRELPDGRLELIDGEMRSDEAGSAPVPVLVTDLTEEEAAKVLATFDPLSALAVPDTAALGELLKSIDLDDDAEIRRMFTDIEDQLEKDEETGELKEQNHEVAGMALTPHEHYDYLVILATNTQEWNVLCDRLKLVPVKRRGRMGTCRAIRAAAVLELLK